MMDTIQYDDPIWVAMIQFDDSYVFLVEHLHPTRDLKRRMKKKTPWPCSERFNAGGTDFTFSRMRSANVYIFVLGRGNLPRYRYEIRSHAFLLKQPTVFDRKNWKFFFTKTLRDFFPLLLTAPFFWVV